MARPSWNLFGRLVRRLPPPDGDRIPDGDLLARFAKDRDQAAFELLVWRHGSLVLGVCRRILRDEQLAEDAFQATFLVLARKAASLDGRNLPGWLHKVARRAAVRSAKQRAKRQARETKLTDHAVHSPSPEPDLKGLLDAEVGRLPDRFRQPVLLCYLQNYTTDEAARALGVPRGTILSRLSTARQQLAARLTKRGLMLPATFVATTAASDQLVSATVRSAAEFALGEAGLTTAPTVLATEVIRMSAWKLPASIAAAMVLTVSVGSGVAWVQGGNRQEQTVPADSAQEPQLQTQKPREPAPRQLTDEEKARQAVESTMRIEIDNLRTYLAERRKDIDKVQGLLAEKTRQRRELSLEDSPALSSMNEREKERISSLKSEIARDNIDLSTVEAQEKLLERYFKEDMAHGPSQSVIDPNSIEGIRLGHMYRGLVESEQSIRTGSRNGNAVDVKVERENLVRLQAEISDIEKRAKANAAEAYGNRLRREYDRKIRQLKTEKVILDQKVAGKQSLFVETREGQAQLKKTLTQVARYDDEIQLLREHLVKLDQIIREQQDKMNKLEIAKLTWQFRSKQEMTLEHVGRELAEIRREIADLKRK